MPALHVHGRVHVTESLFDEAEATGEEQEAEGFIARHNDQDQTA